MSPKEGMFPFPQSSGTQTPYHVMGVLLWQAQTCWRAACSRSNPESAPVFWQMQHCLPSSRLQLPECWNQKICLFLSNFPLWLVHSVSFLGGHRYCFGDDPAQEMFRFLCSLAALSWSYVTLNQQENPDVVLCQNLCFLAIWDRNLKQTKSWDRIASQQKAHRLKKKKKSF